MPAEILETDATEQSPTGSPEKRELSVVDRIHASLIGANVLRLVGKGYSEMPAKAFTLYKPEEYKGFITTDGETLPRTISPEVAAEVQANLAKKGVIAEVTPGSDHTREGDPIDSNAWVTVNQVGDRKIERPMATKDERIAKDQAYWDKIDADPDAPPYLKGRARNI